MSQQFSGEPALVANNLPTSKTVSAATNATPIVVTTTTNHGLKTGDTFSISGVLGNLAANGTFVAGAVTLTTVVLLAFPGGTNVAGTGAYTSGGTLLSLGFGVTFPLPNDTTDGLRAGTVNPALEALGDRTAYLMQFVGPNATTFVRKSGDTMSGNLHMAQGTSIVADGTGATIAGTWSATGAWGWQGGSAAFDVDVAVEAGRTLTCVSPIVLGAGESLNITGATNATPIVVTVSGHALVDGQEVTVAGVGGNTAANGTWVVDVLSGSTFSLVGSAGNGAYTSGGTIAKTANVKHSVSRTVTRTLANFWTDGNTWSDSAWSATVNGVFTAINGTPTTQLQHCGFEIDLPHGANIISAGIYMQPNGGHAAFPGGAPGTFPNVKLKKFIKATGVVSTLASATDPNTANAGVYESYTLITATIGSDEFADCARCRYFVLLETETGANALDGTRVFAGEVTYATQFAEQN